LNPPLYEVFLHQCEKWNRKNTEEGKNPIDSSGWWDNNSHLAPEFCKIICVSYGYFHKGEIIIKSLYGDDEAKLMVSVAALFNKVEQQGLILCGAGITRYDMPWLSKRMMSNGVIPPKSINVYGIKPWNVNVYDIIEVWGQGCKQESYTPMEMICVSLGIKSSKEELSGDKVAGAYFDGRLEEIKNYCEKDVEATVKCADRLIQLSY
jgi:predicted PolB exonuclease-like 3'-5' exonuclease